MNLSRLKKEIENKNKALEELLKKYEAEQKKPRFFKNNKKIDKLQSQIAELDKEISRLDQTYNTQLGMKNAAGSAIGSFGSFIKKHKLTAVIGCAVLGLSNFVYLYFKPLNVNGEQTTYRAKISSFENIEISSSDYTPETYERYMSSLEDAEAQTNDLFMSDEEKLSYIGTLQSSYDALEPMPDKSSLLSALNKANQYDTSEFTPASASEFTSAISKIQMVYDDSNATVQEVEEAEASIDDAYLLLTQKADKTELSELYSKYSGYVLDGYTPSSVRNFNTEVQRSRELIDDENSPQDTINKQVLAMQSLETVLVKKADKSSLQSVIDDCSKLDGSKYKTGYTELSSQLRSSEAILSSDDASQEEVDSAVSRLREAKSNLVEYTVNVYRVNMYAKLKSNHSVGNDWSYTRYYNDEDVHNGFEVTGEPGSTVTVGMEITENDKSPDSGYEETSITLEDGFQTSFEITVREDRGRYAGNTATFTVNVTVSYLRKK